MKLMTSDHVITNRHKVAYLSNAAAKVSK